jgi:hypothetical protein
VPPSFELENEEDTIVVTLDPDANAGSHPLSNGLGAAGLLELYVGGSFDVPFDVSTGSYSGTFDVTVSYN